MCSDGKDEPAALVERAKAKGLRCISITDHDTFDGLVRAQKKAKELGVELISGIEVTAVWEGRDIHILGYFCDPTNLGINFELENQAKLRAARARGILKKLAGMGVELSYEKVKSFAKGAVIGRPHIAAALLAEDYVSSYSEAFAKYLGDDGPASVEKKGLSPQAAIRLIENAGGIAVMAHPAVTRMDALIPKLVEAGLAGLEVFCPSQKGATARRYSEIASRYHLVKTGGSDSHGEDTGAALGCMKMPYTVVENLKRRYETRER
jgi:predicted metal-dependent phosphoesterase TrpH